MHLLKDDGSIIQMLCDMIMMSEFHCEIMFFSVCHDLAQVIAMRTKFLCCEFQKYVLEIVSRLCAGQRVPAGITTGSDFRVPQLGW